MDLVSVIITTYNRSNYIEETLYSIQNQTYKNIEILVIDDGSKDCIANEIKTICTKFSKCTYYFKPNTGQPDSRNFGIKKAKGTFIGFCDDDDYWTLDKLEKQVAILNNNPEYAIVTGCIEYIDTAGNSLNTTKCHTGNNHGYVFYDFVKKNRTDSVTPLLRKEVFEKAGYFNPNFVISEDWDFWRRASYYYKFYALEEVLAFVRKHQSNMTNTAYFSVFDRIAMYQKVTDSLLMWGKDKFTLEELKKIKKIEVLEYKRLITNNYPSLKNKYIFIVSNFFKEPKITIKLLFSLFSNSYQK